MANPFLDAIENPSEAPAAPVTTTGSAVETALEGRGMAYPPGSEIIDTGYPNAGRIIRMRDGTLVYVDASYSTTDRGEIENIIRNKKQLQTGEAPTPEQKTISEMDRAVIEQQMGGVGKGLLQKNIEGYIGGGSYLDELVGAIQGPRKGFEAKQMSEAMQREYPISSTAAQTAGTITSAIGASGPLRAAGGKILSTIPAAERAVESLKTMPTSVQAAAGATAAAAGAGTEGLLYGYGKGEGETRMQTAQDTALTNMMFATPVGAAVPYLGRMVTAIKNRPGKTTMVNEIAEQFGISIPAARIIDNALSNDMSFGDMIANLRRAGDEGMIADANEATKVLLDQAAASSPKVAQQARGAVEQRAEALSGQLGQRMDETLGVAPTGQQTAIEAVGQATKGARKDAYRDAYTAPIDYASPAGDALRNVVGRIPKRILDDAMQKGREMAQWKGYKIDQIEFDLDAAGNVIGFKTLPNVMQLDYLKRALNQMARAGDNVDMFGNLQGDGIMLAEMASAVRKALGDASPAYNKAVQIGGDKILTEQALIIGGKIFGTGLKRDTVAKTMKEASQMERQAAKLGVRNAIDEIMAEAKTAATTGADTAITESRKIISTMSSRANRTKVELILGKKQSDELYKKMDEVAAALELRARVAPKSDTATRLAGQKAVDEALAPGFIRSIGDLDFKQAYKRLQEIVGTPPQTKEEMAQGVWTEITDVLTKVRGKDATAALKYLEQVKGGKPLSQPQEAFLINTIIKHSALGGAKQPTRQ